MTTAGNFAVPSLWEKCLNRLNDEFPNEFNTWIRPLHPVENENKEENVLLLLAPNQFVMEWVKQHFLNRIMELIEEVTQGEAPVVKLAIGSRAGLGKAENTTENTIITEKIVSLPDRIPGKTNLLSKFTFENFVEGNSNQLALAAAIQIVENPGHSYNPFYLYGGVGLGKTHLMHAIGNMIVSKYPHMSVLYLYSERFVRDMVNALKDNKIDDFKRFYRSVDVLLIDDVQFIAGKERSQEEFFHIFNSLFEEQRQIILSCDRYLKEINGLDDRLASRFGWGLTAAIEPPELETRVAILMSKAIEYHHVNLPDEVAFFIAKKIRSNVRELEGALKRVIATANFTSKPITIDFAREALKDLLAVQDKLVTIENIIKTVAEYFKIKVSDLLSKQRSRSIAYPRQMAMALARELTGYSLPEIGNAMGGRDHTTVIHACRKVKELIKEKSTAAEDYKNLIRALTT